MSLIRSYHNLLIDRRTDSTLSFMISLRPESGRGWQDCIMKDLSLSKQLTALYASQWNGLVHELDRLGVKTQCPLFCQSKGMAVRTGMPELILKLCSLVRRYIIGRKMRILVIR